MAVIDQISEGVTKHSRLIIGVLLIMTAAIGSGAPMVEQSSSLNEFQSDTSQAADAQAYIDSNFSDGSSNTTAVQIIIQGDNILSKQSLIKQLNLQREIRNNTTVNKTLATDSQTVGIAPLVATAAVQMERAENLTERGDRLQQKGQSLKNRSERLQQRREQLNERKANLTARGKQLQQRGQKLKQRGQELNESRRQLREEGKALSERADELNESRRQLQADAADLKQRAEALNESRKKLERKAARLKQRADELNESRAELKQRKRTLKRRADELNESRVELEQRKRTLKRRAQELNATRETLQERARSLERRKKELAADRRNGTVPPDELRRRSKNLTREARDLANDTAALSARATALEQGRDALKRDAAELRERAQQLNASRRQLQADAADLKQQSKNLSREFDSLQQRKQDLKETGNQLQAARKRLDARPHRLKQKGKQLQAKKRRLDARAQQLQQKGAQLAADKRALEQQLQQLQANRSALENDSAALKERGRALQNDAEGLKSDQVKLEQQADALEADRKALQNGHPNLSLAERIAVLESRNQSEIETAVEAVLGNHDTGRENGSERDGAFMFMPTNYDPGTTTATATMILVTQSSQTPVGQAGTASNRLIDSQLAIQDITHKQYDEDSAYVFGAGIISDKIERSMTDSLVIVGPLAVVFVLFVLIIAYRDALDILLGLLGIALVLVWTFGFMGWAGISFSQVFIAVPVLLIGLSIDYAIHVFMRHREARESIRGVHASMQSTLDGIGTALILVTLTAVIGFLSNLTSSVPPIREFGIVSSVGICAALIIFGVLIPALKTELDSALEARGWDRNKRAFGTGGGTLGSLLVGGATAARRAPHIVIVVALVLTVAGGFGAAHVDTSFSQEDFLADDPPAWMDSMPEPLAPGDYNAKSSLDYVNDHFLREDSNAEILIRGNVTDSKALQAINRAEQNASTQDTTVVLSSGNSDIKSPLSVMESVAAKNEPFNQTLVASDTNGDGVPDTNLDHVYDVLYEVDSQAASSVIYRTDEGTYEALYMSVPVDGNAPGDAVTTQMHAVAASVEQSSDLRATATGQPIVFKIVQDQLLQTVVESLLITLIVTFIFLMIVYRFLHGSATLGFVTLLPVACSVAWILGTMYLLGIPFNVITGLITSLTVGLGIAYSIHLSERYSLELKSGASVWRALRTAVTGTGGALLGSAATTVGGFGVLAFAILPPLRQFGIITGLTIIYAFLASVFVLPSLLAVWTRWFGPNDPARSSQWTFGPSERRSSTDDD